ncbi:hypothetical protein PIB30_038323 [Stylosanthes scabra]|uniref:Uncharacterized protein n=1 Tax=Stylosanthes scabra TaxID=79078 RepID=A0ABU6VEN1_9FABA|nr:hypothetical protein [Stylosanthes scabra]
MPHGKDSKEVSLISNQQNFGISARDCDYQEPHNKEGGGRWRIRGWNGGLSMRTVFGCAWMLDGATKDCVYTLTLASRSKGFCATMNRFGWSPSRFARPFWEKNTSFNEYRIDSQNREPRSKRVRGLELGLRQQRTIGSSKCLWGFSFHVGQKLTSRLTVAAGGPPANVPATNLGFNQ